MDKLQSISLIANIIFSLLLFFQWDRKHAKEQSTKNSILATRRMLCRIKDVSANDIIDNIDATLASLNARSPFIEWSKTTLNTIKQKFSREEKVALSDLERQEI